MRYELEGKTALVTGASRGFGERISLELLKRGTFVIGTARSEAPKSLQEYVDQGKASYNRADLTTDWKSLIDKIYDKFGGFEIFVNNAGMLSTDYLPRLKPEEIAREIKLDLEVPMLIHTRWLELYDKRYPKVRQPELSINLASISSFYSWTGGANYQAAKSGLAAFVWGARVSMHDLNNAAPEVKKKVGPSVDLNMRFVAIYPDSTDTGMISRAEQESLYQVRGDLLPPEIVTDVIIKIAEGTGKFGEFDDIMVLANPTSPKTGEELRGIYAGFLPIDPQTRRPAFHKRILEKIADEDKLVKKEEHHKDV